MATSYSISPNPASVNEGTGTLTFTITRSGTLPAETIFASTTTNQGSTNSSDYNPLLNQPVSFASNQTSQTVSISILNDSVVENNETFGFIVQRNSSDPVSTFLASSSFTIVDNDAATTTYSISPNSTTVNESAGTVTFTVTRSGSLPAETLFVSTETGEGSANNADYTGKLNEQLTFSSGQSSRTVTVSITNDAVTESSETFGLLIQRNASDPATTFLAKSTFTIADDDVAATTTYSISPNSTTVNESAGTVTFTVTRSGSLPAETLFVSTETGEGSANNADYTGKLNEQLTFSSGQSSRTVTVSITNDAVTESSETFGLLIQRNASDPATTFLAKSTFTIADDDVAATTTYSISPNSTTVNESAGTVTFTVTRSGSLPAETLFVSTETGEGSANNADYTGKLNEQLTFAAGQSSRTVTVPITNDLVPETNETFGLLVQRNASDSAATFLAKSTFTIADDDAAGTIYSISPTPNPVNENAGTETFTITRTGSLPAETVFASTLQGAANGYDANTSDYNGLVNQQVSFGANQTSAQVTISVVNNATPEPDETFGFIVQRNASDPVATFLARANWTVHDDDAAGTSYSISSSPNPVNENVGTETFTITRSGASLPAETVFASTLQGASNGYAANSNDYNGLLNRPVSFIANQTSAQITVSVTNDSVSESDDTFGLIVQRNASDPVSTFLARANWTIHDDDTTTATSYTVVANPNPVTENAGTATFTITRSGGLPAEILYASTLNGSLVGYSGNVSDYSGIVNQPVPFAANQTSAQVTIPINNDTVPENDETFGFIVQRNPSDSVATYLAQTNWAIHDNDTGTIADYSVTPSARVVNVDQGTITFTVARTGTDLPAETVYASTVEGINGYAINAGDWTNSVHFQPVEFLAGSTTASSTISLNLANVASATTALQDFGFIVQRAQNSASHILAQTNFAIQAAAQTFLDMFSSQTPTLRLPFSETDNPNGVRVNQQFGEGVTDPDGTHGFVQGTNDHGKNDPIFTADKFLYYAIDFHADPGTRVLSQGIGRVVESRDTVREGEKGPSDGFGNYVTVEYQRPGGHFYATYMHLEGHLNSRYIPAADTGVVVGQLIGYSGDTGIPGVPHLHVTYGNELTAYHNGDGDTIAMADGSFDANPVGGPVRFLDGELSNNGVLYDVDNEIFDPTDITRSQSLIGSGAHNTLTVSADQVGTSSASLTTEGHFANLTDTDLGKLVTQATNFGEMVLNNFRNLIVGALNGTGLLGHTVYFNGADGGDNLDASATDTSIVAIGGSGGDLLVGGAAGDVLNGAVGNDTLTGGGGADTFVYATGGGTDFITDFHHSEADRIDLTGVAHIHSLADLQPRIAQNSPDTILDFGNGDTLTVGGVNGATLNEADFIFSAPSLYNFFYLYPDGARYHGTVVDDGRFGYHVGQQIDGANGGYYYIYGNAGSTNQAVGTVTETVYIDSANQNHAPVYTSIFGHSLGNGLGNDHDYVEDVNHALHAFGSGGAYEAAHLNSRDSFNFFYMYPDGAHYYGTVVDDGGAGYHVGQQINGANGGYYYIYDDAGPTNQALGTVTETVYIDSANQSHAPIYTSILGHSLGSGLGNDHDYVEDINHALHAFGSGGAYEAAHLNGNDSFDFFYMYPDGAHYYGTVVDDGSAGYHVGQQITGANGGYYYIYDDAGPTNQAVGTVTETVYIDSANRSHAPIYTSILGHSLGIGLGNDHDYVYDNNQNAHPFGSGGAYEFIA